jgi:folate-binding protein YgfZ
MNATETNPASMLQPTALAANLAAAKAQTSTGCDWIPYRGVLTPRQLDAPEVETGALLFGAAVYDLGWLRRIAVRGEDRFRWLSGMVTNAVETLADKTGAYNLVLNAQGRIQGDCYVWRGAEASESKLEIEATADQAEALLAHFDRFIVMDDVELVSLEDLSALGLAGPEAEKLLQSLGIAAPGEGLASRFGSVAGIAVRLCRRYSTAVPHFALWAAADAIPALWQALVTAGATAVGAEAIEALRVAEGIPAYRIDIQSRDLAQETSQMRAISFTKGCYLGQEIVERVRSRGQVHRHLRALEMFPADPGEMPAPGAELRIANAAADSKIAGTLTSVGALKLDGERRIFAIGMIRAEAQVGNQQLVWTGGTAEILNSPPKFMPAREPARENA